MVIAINYANEKFYNAQKLNSKQARKFGADKVIEYKEDSLPADFVNENSAIFSHSRGGGYWVWKPYIILNTMRNANDGDIIIYTDAGSAFVRPIKYLLDSMNSENTDVMCFCIDQIEKKWVKRDALVLMECDNVEFLNTAQICSGYIILRNNEKTRNLVTQFYEYCKDTRIVTDEPNVMGKENYPEFIENRHDQAVWSLLCKKNGIKPFRDPSEWGVDYSKFPQDVLDRSNYPQVIESHRNPLFRYSFELAYNTNCFTKLIRKIYNILKND